MGQVAGWLAVKAGLKVVPADAVLLPNGFSMFNNELAKQVGVDRAAMHQKIKGWQEYNCRKDKRSHFRQDRWWTYGRPEYWLEKEFVWSSLTTVRRAFKDLEKAGLMIIDQAGGNYWLSVISGEAVSLAGGQTTMQLGLFEVDKGVPNRRSSIEKQTTLKQAKKKKQTTINPRKDAVADFHIPDARNNADFEIRESRESGNDGHDELFGLPSELLAGWKDSEPALIKLVAQHGIERINEEWPQTAPYKNRIGGLRTRLASTPSPRCAAPPSPAADDDTEPDGLFEEAPGNETPAIDEPVNEPELTPQQKHLIWAKTHCGSAIYAQLVAEFEAEQHANAN